MPASRRQGILENECQCDSELLMYVTKYLLALIRSYSKSPYSLRNIPYDLHYSLPSFAPGIMKPRAIRTLSKVKNAINARRDRKAAEGTRKILFD
jgi:hypothetical protein